MEISSFYESILKIKILENYCKKIIYNSIIYIKKKKKKIDAMFNNLNGKRISIFGITFKANTNDVRESAAM